MDENYPANLERDPRFPSGVWTGFFLQYCLPGRHKTDMHLTWSGGGITGHGKDRVGTFTISGTYDPTTGRCEWTKKYTGKHSVAYRGLNDGHGVWGVWEIRLFGRLFVDRGGFHMWPERHNVSEESDQTEKAVLEAMREEFKAPPHQQFIAFLLLAMGIGLGLLIWWKTNP